MEPPLKLDEQSLLAGVKALAQQDADLAGIYAAWGAPPLWERPAGFPTLVHIILEQQVSLASARAAFDRLRAALPRLAPEEFLTLDDVSLKQIGFSRQKTAYCRGLAEAIAAGRLDLAGLGALDDEQVRAELIKIKGIGPWSADIYLLMALLRPDIWPVGDLALAVAVQRVKRLPGLPSRAEMAALGEAWRPWRAVASRLFWHAYLSSPREMRPA